MLFWGKFTSPSAGSRVLHLSHSLPHLLSWVPPACLHRPRDVLVGRNCWKGCCCLLKTGPCPLSRPALGVLDTCHSLLLFISLLLCLRWFCYDFQELHEHSDTKIHSFLYHTMRYIHTFYTEIYLRAICMNSQNSDNAPCY